jgi:branched-chain amino acid transport system substrate-binding protein
MTKRSQIARRTLLGAGLAAGSTVWGVGRAWAQAGEPVRIGVLNDESGPYADLSGPGSVLAARMAIADFGGSVLGRQIEVLIGDHQNKADVGLAIVREWLASKGVDVVVDFGNSAISLGAQTLVQQYDKLALHVASTSSEITGKSCVPNSIQWAQNTYADANGLARGLLRTGKTTFFFITVDYAFGQSVEADAAQAITSNGGKIIGSVKHPLNTTDFSSYLVFAQASGAEVVVLANSGSDFIMSVKQANEFGISPRQLLAAPIVYLTDIHALGLEAAQGLQFVQSWYWDLDDQSRAWAKRFFAEQKRMPTDLQAGVYSATLHYLKAVQQAGTVQTGPVLAAMKAMPVDDMYTRHGRIEANNKMVFDLYLMRAKRPEESKYPWDYLDVVARIPAAEAFRPPAESGCNLVAG